MRSGNRGRAGGALFAACLFAAWAAAAQSPAAGAKGPNFAGEQQKQQLAQPLNNQPVWKEVRSGAPQTTTVLGRETNVLIQPEGQTWRAARVPVATAGGLLIALALAGLALVFLLRGPLQSEQRPGDRVIERFAPADRWSHWLQAIVWVTLAVTGLILSLGKAVLLPLVGYTLFSWLATLAKNVHNFIGPILIVAVPWMFVRYVRHNGIGGEDLKWFLHIRDYFKGNEYPSGKFNAGEKFVFWILLVALTTTLIVTGLILAFPNFDQTRQTMQLSNIIHMAAAYVAMAIACVHIYLGTIGMVGAYQAMRTGYADASWCEHHHQRWYEDVVAGKASEKFVEPGAAVPDGAAQPRPA